MRALAIATLGVHVNTWNRKKNREVNDIGNGKCMNATLRHPPCVWCLAPCDACLLCPLSITASCNSRFVSEAASGPSEVGSRHALSHRHYLTLGEARTSEVLGPQI